MSVLITGGARDIVVDIAAWVAANEPELRVVFGARA